MKFTSGPISNNYDQCNCVSGYKWDTNIKKCVIDCTKISNGISLVSGTLDTCTCNISYIWNNTISKCIVNCTNIPYTLNIK